MPLDSYPDLDAEMMQRVTAIISQNTSDASKGQSLLWAVYWWRGACAARSYIEKFGPTVKGGLFSGMRWPARTLPGKTLPTLLGTFESALQVEIARCDERRYERVINVGCGIGEYAVGFALRWPDAKIYAHDVDAVALSVAREIAELNFVEDRVVFAGPVDHGTLDSAIEGRTLVFCDIEGAEEFLLDPQSVPNLSNADIIVEVHEILRPGLIERLCPRFEATHEVVLVDKWQSELTDDPYFLSLPEIDRIVATCELRDGPTPWAVMRSKAWPSAS